MDSARSHETSAVDGALKSDLEAALAGVKNQLQQRERELGELREQQAATGEILRVISRSPNDVQPVFDTIAKAALQLCRASVVNMVTYDGRLLHVGSIAVQDPVSLDQARGLFPCPPSATTVAGRAVLARSVVAIPDVVEDPQYAFQDGPRIGIRSVLGIPLMNAGRPIGALAICRAEPGPFPESQLALLMTFADQAVIAIENTHLHIALRQEVEAHRKSKATIRVLVEQEEQGGPLLGCSDAIARVREMIGQVAPTDSTVLIQGETGTGKELVARALHAASGRSGRALIKLNCAALPRELIESELFGHERGAFTGATQLRRGRFELADGGTLFLDEVGELPGEAQAKLLRVLQEREFERIGGTRSLKVDVRVIAATNRVLQTEVEAGRFRSDLFYRLNVFPIELPPLRDRTEDVPTLLRHAAERIARRLGREFTGFTSGFEERARRHDWPGNVRELENAVERALIMARNPVLEASDFPLSPIVRPALPMPVKGSLEDMERDHIRRVLEDANWKVEGAAGAANALGLNASTLRNRMRKLGLRRPS